MVLEILPAWLCSREARCGIDLSGFSCCRSPAALHGQQRKIPSVSPPTPCVPPKPRAARGRGRTRPRCGRSRLLASDSGRVRPHHGRSRLPTPSRGRPRRAVSASARAMDARPCHDRIGPTTTSGLRLSPLFRRQRGSRRQRRTHSAIAGDGCGPMQQRRLVGSVPPLEDRRVPVGDQPVNARRRGGVRRQLCLRTRCAGGGAVTGVILIRNRTGEGKGKSLSLWPFCSKVTEFGGISKTRLNSGPD